MKRISTMATTAVLLMMLAAFPAQAQYGGGVVAPAAQDGQIEQTTPCSTIIVQGTSWGPGTTVYIDREFDGDCPGSGNPRDVLAEGSDDDTRAAESAEVTVAEDGSFVAELLVPADAVGAYEVEVSGTDIEGTAKRQTYSFDVDPTANFVVDATGGTPAAGGGNTATMALAAVLAALILAVGFNWPTLVARVRR